MDHIIPASRRARVGSRTRSTAIVRALPPLDWNRLATMRATVGECSLETLFSLFEHDARGRSSIIRALVRIDQRDLVGF